MLRLIFSVYLHFAQIIVGHTASVCTLNPTGKHGVRSVSRNTDSWCWFGAPDMIRLILEAVASDQLKVLLSVG